MWKRKQHAKTVRVLTHSRSRIVTAWGIAPAHTEIELPADEAREAIDRGLAEPLEKAVRRGRETAVTRR